MRRALFPEHPLGFVEPPTGTDRSILWPYVQAAAAVHGGDIALVLRALDYRPRRPGRRGSGRPGRVARLGRCRRAPRSRAP